MTLKEGRVTIPTNLDVVPETIELMKRWGADAIRDCDGTEFPEELVRTGASVPPEATSGNVHQYLSRNG